MTFAADGRSVGTAVPRKKRTARVGFVLTRKWKGPHMERGRPGRGPVEEGEKG